MCMAEVKEPTFRQDNDWICIRHAMTYDWMSLGCRNLISYWYLQQTTLLECVTWSTTQCTHTRLTIGPLWSILLGSPKKYFTHYFMSFPGDVLKHVYVQMSLFVCCSFMMLSLVLNTASHEGSPKIFSSVKVLCTSKIRHLYLLNHVNKIK